jgi:hypothetical protein
MKKTILSLTILITLLSCTNEPTSASQNDKSKAPQTSEIKKEINIKEDEPKEEEISAEDEKNAELEKLKAKYKHVRAKFVSVDAGDLIHHVFRAEGGREFDFNIIQDNTFDLTIDDPSSESGIAINRKYKNNYFDIFYKVEKHDLLGWGTKENCDVVKKMILVE